ncbi:3-oxoacyl-ACP reductase FabG [Christensenellaceae bacterium NSJ-63]|uniref:3-oxoacyl-ACP reductase FabG n=1 Tax=Guopingia tenuis TaxID=2763656 RepID=A0A926DGQ2_9FIRM|nr:3-oxoacyl-ACP reductase FabG [Guopingia tenuis]MBC8537474.1 3-oxoacyl-ACP reductase FabG [Guopingia tenuis]
MRQKTVWITGASRGIGRQAALDFGRQGWNVVIHCHTHREEAEAVRQSIGRNAIVTAGDVASREEVHAVYQKALDAFGRVDVLINNAAVASQELFTEMQEENWRRIFAVNVEGVYHCTQTVLPDMIRRREGKIVNISSMWGQVGASCEVCYSATKAAVIGMTKALAKEVGLSGIQVNCVAPGVIATEMNAHLSGADMQALAEDTPLGRLGAPEDISRALLFLASEDADFITGQVLGVNGGFVI